MKKKDGFNNQLSITLPQAISDEITTNPLTKLLYITDIGYYPDAQYHFRERQNGCDQNIIIFCTKGEGWIETRDGIRTLEKDTFFIIPAGLSHKYGSNNKNPWSIYWLHFKGEQSPIFAGKTLKVIHINNTDNTRNDRRIRLFEEICQTLSMGYSKENIEYVTICLWYLLGSFNYIPQFERIRTVQQTDVIEKSILYMNDHIESTITLSDLAVHTGYSPSHFSLLFKRKTTRSPMEYFLDLKMQRACQMLDLSDMKIISIAKKLAFDDPYYFSRMFKKTIGVSPTEYRDKIKG